LTRGFDQKLKELESEISKIQQARYSSHEEEKGDKLKPKKFGFKRPAAQVQGPSTSNSNPSEAKSADRIPSSLSNGTTNPLDLKPHSENLFIRPSSPLQPLHILALADLSNVVLDLRALFPHLSTLQLSRIHHAAVLAPPLSGSTSLAQVSHSILLLVSQQVSASPQPLIIFLSGPSDMNYRTSSLSMPTPIYTIIASFLT
jgi:hypothetical protein